MDVSEVLKRIRSERGVIRAELMPEDLFARIVEEESTVRGVMGNIPIINTGLRDCADRNVRLVVFDDGTIHHPQVHTMRMLDELGNEIGHNVTKCEVFDFMNRGDVVFISDDFVIYPGIEIHGSVSMEMLAHPFRGRDKWMPESAGAVMWYPSSTSSDMIFKYFGQPSIGIASSILGFNVRGGRPLTDSDQHPVCLGVQRMV